MKKYLVCLVVILFVASLVFISCAQPAPKPTPTPSPAPAPAPAPAKAIELNFVTFIPTSNPEHAVLFRPFIKMVNERAKGELVINERGGPEVIAANDLLAAVKKGTIEMTNCPTSFYGSSIPGSDTTRLSEVVEREVPGCFEYIQSLYAKEGVYYLGRSQIKGQNFLFTFYRKPVASTKDMNGLRIGGASASYNTFYQSLGMTPLNIPLSEYYTAVERGVVDACASSIQMWFGQGIWEKTPYFIDHGWSRQPSALIINMDAWNKLPAHLQKLLKDTQVDFENQWYIGNENMKKDIQKNTEAKGAKFVTLTDANVYMKNFFETGWAYDYARYPKDIVQTLEKMIRKTT